MYFIKKISRETIRNLGLPLNRNFKVYLTSPFLVQFYKSLERKEFIFSVVEYIDSSTLAQEVQISGPLDETAVLFYIAEIVVTLEELHNRQIVYG